MEHLPEAGRESVNFAPQVIRKLTIRAHLFRIWSRFLRLCKNNSVLKFYGTIEGHELLPPRTQTR